MASLRRPVTISATYASFFVRRAAGFFAVAAFAVDLFAVLFFAVLAFAVVAFAVDALAAGLAVARLAVVRLAGEVRLIADAKGAARIDPAAHRFLGPLPQAIMELAES